jgi:DNA-binding HxlR family transcriptional regulator
MDRPQEGTLRLPDHRDVPIAACTVVKDLLSRVGDKWSVVIVAVLREGPMRFNAIRRSLEGISQRMLTLTLRGLERDGLVVRRVFPTVPPQVEYELTNLGRTLLDPVLALAAWAETHHATIDEARARFDSMGIR